MDTRILFVVSGMALAGVAFAEDVPVESVEVARPVGFAEVLGGYGLQLGRTPYVPKDGEFRHPMTHGYAFGVAGGVSLTNATDVVFDYEYTKSHSVSGNIPNAVDDITGTISYQSLVAGVRTGCRMGPGRLYGELAGGVVAPFHTEVEYDYAAALTQLPTPIRGVGTRVDEYGWALGGQGAMGYQLSLAERLYFTGLVKIRAFETSNNEESTRLKNFVSDFTAKPPKAETTTIRYSKELGGNQPNTYSVQDARAQIAIGVRF